MKKEQKKYGDVEKSARLKTLILTLGVKQTVFAEKMGLSRTAITQMLNGDRDVGENIAFKIERIFPNVNSDWLMNGEGQMMREKKALDMVAEPREAYQTEINRLRAELERERSEKAMLMEVIKNLSKK